MLTYIIVNQRSNETSKDTFFLHFQISEIIFLAEK